MLSGPARVRRGCSPSSRAARRTATDSSSPWPTLGTCWLGSIRRSGGTISSRTARCRWSSSGSRRTRPACTPHTWRRADCRMTSCASARRSCKGATRCRARCRGCRRSGSTCRTGAHPCGNQPPRESGQFALQHALPAPAQAQGGLQPRPASANGQSCSGWPADTAALFSAQVLHARSATQCSAPLARPEETSMRMTLVLACRPAHEPLGATGRRGMHAWRAASPLAIALYFRNNLLDRRE